MVGAQVVDDGEAALDAAIAEFAAHEKARGWARALRVAQRVELEPADIATAEEQAALGTSGVVFRRLPAREFARRAGIRVERVKAYQKAWRRAAADNVVPKAGALRPSAHLDLPDDEQTPFFGEKGYYHGYEASLINAERVKAIEAEAAAAGIRPTATVYVAKNLKALKTAVLADEDSRSAAIEALAEYEARQAAADTADRAAAAGVRKKAEAEHDEHNLVSAPREKARKNAAFSAAGSAGDTAMEVFNAMADVRLGTVAALSLLQTQQVHFNAEQAHAIAELCDAATSAIAFIRDIAAGPSTALNDEALKAFLDESGKLL
jgi:hypothetical protein